MTRPTIIAVCGLSGVGKTYLINAFLAVNRHAVRLSAGAIIAEARAITDPEFLRNLPADELDRSQQLLIAGFPRALSALNTRLLLLDAHTVIDNGDELYTVTDAVFIALAPDGIIHVEAEPIVIARQRQSDHERTRPFRSVEVLGQHQQVSARRALEIAARLKVSCARVGSGDLDAFSRLLNSQEWS